MVQALRLFPELAEKYNIPTRWASIISDTLERHLSEFGYVNSDSLSDKLEFTDSMGRTVSDVRITVNGKGHYVISANIGSNQRRRFIRPNMDLFDFFDRNLFFKSDQAKQIEILELLFPPK